MIDTKELRRLAQAALAGPDGISLNWIKLLQDFQQSANPAAISELLDRLEAAEKERDALRVELETERVRLAACGVVALANTPDSAKRARDMLPEYWSASCGDVARMVDENIRLRAKIEAMEKQEPVAWCATDETGTVIEALGMNQSRRFDTALYLAPGAKGETK